MLKQRYLKRGQMVIGGKVVSQTKSANYLSLSSFPSGEGKLDTIEGAYISALGPLLVPTALSLSSFESVSQVQL